MVVLFELSEASLSSFSTHVDGYKIFLSFRGVVTHHSFTNYEALVGVHKKVFLVLDDIRLLDVLPGSKGFHPESKIIIITKNTWLTKSCALLMCNHPKANNEVTVEKLVKYCQGHPLAFEVLGKSLHNRDVTYWEGCIKGLKKEIGPPINNVLRISFDSLPSSNDKELFKHIACLFVGIDRDVTETILKACDMLETFKLARSFEMKMETDALSNMDNLILLQLNYVHMNGSYENFPEELRGLCMHGFPLKSIPSYLATA